MNEQQINALVELAETIADNKFIMGEQLVELGVSGPNLEASLASISMAQGDLGHARLLYRWSFEVQGKRAGKVDVKEQTGKAFNQIVNASNWVELLAGLYVNNVAINLVMEELMKNKGEELNAQFAKMSNELTEHVMYAKNWCLQLLEDQGSIPRRTRVDLEKAYHHAGEWIRQVEGSQPLIEAGVVSESSKLSSAFASAMNEVLGERYVSHV
ncbi:1,2-phenylacetyl-CoA epoxidase, catalytic subunit [Thalassobacillus cyri]|uniref:1,2-phenylacetyl-CoA epoxidase, catalytic subunit n=1 Tax=Thalassobacillus cyri TaxID=571932 RepID=A0A1H3ZDM7_9BACI|nr:Phenylacetic acid catabolic protein [Thalassobacillus cyri]SEA21628.1 1,2-phenylacetyl-CoA epoxidase, catalytic subunit [Thalassobacillus cyri]